MYTSLQKDFFFSDQNDLDFGKFLVLDPLSKCGRAYLKCPRMRIERRKGNNKTERQERGMESRI